MPYLAANACKKRWSSGFLKSSWIMLWSTYWTAKGTSTLSTPIRSNCRQAIVPVASCSSVWSILKPTSSPGSSEPLTMCSSSILVTRFSAIAHPRKTSSVDPYSTQPPAGDTPLGAWLEIGQPSWKPLDRRTAAEALSPGRYDRASRWMNNLTQPNVTGSAAILTATTDSHHTRTEADAGQPRVVFRLRTALKFLSFA